MNKIFTSALIALPLFAFSCNINTENYIYHAYNILSKSLPVKTENTKLVKLIVNQRKKEIIKYEIIEDPKIIKELKNKIFKKIAFYLQKENLCLAYKKGIGKCFLSLGNKIEVVYLTPKEKEIGKIIISKKDCGD